VGTSDGASLTTDSVLADSELSSARAELVGLAMAIAAAAGMIAAARHARRVEVRRISEVLRVK